MRCALACLGDMRRPHRAADARRTAGVVPIGGRGGGRSRRCFARFGPAFDRGDLVIRLRDASSHRSSCRDVRAAAACVCAARRVLGGRRGLRRWCWRRPARRPRGPAPVTSLVCALSQARCVARRSRAVAQGRSGRPRGGCPRPVAPRGSFVTGPQCAHRLPRPPRRCARRSLRRRCALPRPCWLARTQR